MKITRALILTTLLCAVLAACTSDSPAGLEAGQASENSGIMLGSGNAQSYNGGMTFGSGNRGAGQDAGSTTEPGTTSEEGIGGFTMGSGNVSFAVGQDTVVDHDDEGSASTQESGGGFLFGSGN